MKFKNIHTYKQDREEEVKNTRVLGDSKYIDTRQCFSPFIFVLLGGVPHPHLSICIIERILPISLSILNIFCILHFSVRSTIISFLLFVLSLFAYFSVIVFFYAGISCRLCIELSATHLPRSIYLISISHNPYHMISIFELSSSTHVLIPISLNCCSARGRQMSQIHFWPFSYTRTAYCLKKTGYYNNSFTRLYY